jgi:hypothetical protein
MIRVATIAAAALLSTTLARAQGLDPYVQLIDQYVSGNADAALGELARRPRTTVSNAVSHWTTDVRLRPELRAGAVMLHTDLACAVAASARGVSAFHFRMAQRLLSSMLDRHGDDVRAPGFAQQWYEFVVSVHLMEGQLSVAAYYAGLGLAAFPGNALLRVDNGIVFEMRAGLNDRNLNGVSSAKITVNTKVAGMLRSAGGEYERALQLDPRSSVARLHRGWVRFLLHDDRARADFDAVVADASEDSARYLAHLFLGSVAEREQRWSDALQEYDAAHEIGPAYQTPYLAMSGLEARLGHEVRARDLALQCAHLVQTGVDPWWTYHLGTVDLEALSRLRTAARTP